MKYIPILSVLVPAVLAQIAPTGAAGIAGTVLDSKTLKAIPAARVIATRASAPPFSRSTRSGGDGAFQIQGLLPGTYSLCVQPATDEYLDPCHWGTTTTSVALSSGQTVSKVILKLSLAAIVSVEITDAKNVIRQMVGEGRRPDLAIGVWGPRKLYHPVHAIDSSTIPPTNVLNKNKDNSSTYSYRIAVPSDIGLSFSIGSRDLKLADSNGIALPANANQQAFQHAGGDKNPKKFGFSVLGRLAP